MRVAPAAAGIAALAASGSASAQDPTYYRDVLPIVQTKCAPCHDVGGIAALDLVEQEIATEFASEMATQTGARAMPPFPPDPDCADYKEHANRSLPDQDIETIRAWAELGGPPGDPNDAPDPPEPPEDPLGEPDLVLATEDPFFFDNQAEDLYWCFRFDPGLDQTRDLVAATVAPDNENVVHHVIVFREEGGVDRKPLDSPGFECGGAPEDGEFLMGWAPGTQPMKLPDGYGVELGDDDALIMQVHYHRYPGALPTDHSQVKLWFAEQPAAKKVRVVWTGSFEILVPPGLKQTVESTCTVPESAAPIELLSIAPHMHQVGQSFSSRIERADGSEQCLIDIPEWDFEWQGGYTFADSITLQPGDVLHTACTYQNFGDSTVSWGEGSDDEMCFQFNFVVADDEMPEFCFDQDEPPQKGGCGCATDQNQGAFALFGLIGLLSLRRRPKALASQ
jgi:MYXO-CTERM domain-containing protein